MKTLRDKLMEKLDGERVGDPDAVIEQWVADPVSKGIDLDAAWDGFDPTTFLLIWVSMERFVKPAYRRAGNA